MLHYNKSESRTEIAIHHVFFFCHFFVCVASPDPIHPPPPFPAYFPLDFLDLSFLTCTLIVQGVPSEEIRLFYGVFLLYAVVHSLQRI
ncbi:hypothetical protein BDV12DRAFT_163455 [Aspergillus spectabilis]